MFSVPDYSNVDKLVSSHLLGGVPSTIVLLNCPLVVHVEELADQLKRFRQNLAKHLMLIIDHSANCIN